MYSQYPDDFQRKHKKAHYVDPEKIDYSKLPEKAEEPEEVDEKVLISSHLEKEEEPQEDAVEKTLLISDGEGGHSYKSLFGPYLKGAREIHLIDPYNRLEYPVRNLLSFIGIIDTVDGSVNFKLTTAADDEYQKRVNERKFEEIAEGVKEHDINDTYEFSETVHRRGIEADNGWSISIDRGLDIFQKPETRYELSEVDQARKQCKETEIIYRKS